MFELIDKIRKHDKHILQPEIVVLVFNKAFQTLAELMTYMNQHVLFPMIKDKYKIRDIENTMKLLIRCKKLLQARKLAY